MKKQQKNWLQNAPLLWLLPVLAATVGAWLFMDNLSVSRAPVRQQAAVLRGQPLKRKAICRTFSDCTTGPRNGLISGCFPLDPFYTAHPDHARLKAAKAGA